ncbi:hypothetical protein WT26_14145 [Burkholderia cepacia]|uniref:Transmembrane protein n=2 Tax=Burkholderia cepacia complex TaxID=87882 RepID=A0A1B4PSZ6_BURCE|nr:MULTISPECIES: hypothetical protein [Burkholderia cepacia complex]AOK17042.1 hypothetical protein WT26_14145 [Burkholderia cepacia]AOK23778.1 hypothetical protein WK67_14080 [Burkholderia ubonensis]
MSPWWLWCLVFATFNLPVVGFLGSVPFGRRLNDMLKEKAPDGSATDATSYSRVSGALGAIMIASFFWATGNLVLGLALSGDVISVKTLLGAVSVFFLIGSALFLPYAFNQLKTLFPWGANAAVAMAQASGEAAIAPSPVFQSAGVPARLVIGNLSSVTDAELGATLAAIQIQINRDFQPEWGATTILVAQQMTSPQSTVQIDAAQDAIIYLGDEAQDPSSGIDSLLGHHYLTNPGVPFGFVFLDACDRRNLEWSVILSHEVLELLADPQASLRVAGPDPTNPDAIAVAFELEVCDATEMDSYLIGTVKVSNFVTQRYFGRNGKSAATNFCRLPLQPFSARPGGYAQYHDSDGVQILNGNHVSQGQLGARAMMGQGRRNARRAAAAAPRRAPKATIGKVL